MKENIVDKLTDNIKKVGEGRTKELIENVKGENEFDLTDMYLNLIKMCDFGIDKVINLNKNSSEKHAMTLKKVKVNLCKLIAIDINNASFKDRFNALFSETLFLKIEACADFIRDNIEVDIDETLISELLIDTQSLIDEIKTSDIQDNVKKILLLQLSGVYDSLIKYNLFGYEEVELSVKLTIGSIIMNFDKNAEVKDKEYIAKSLKLMSKFNTVFSFVKNVTYLAGACTVLLPQFIK